MMHFSLKSLFRPKPYERETVARLRDQTIELGTRVLLLEDIVQHSRKPVRAIRKDAGAYRDEAAKRRAELVSYASELKRTAG